MPFDDLLADRKPYTGAGIILSGVKTLEDDKYPFSLPGIYADTIIPNGEDLFFSLSINRNMNSHGLTIMKFDSIADKVLK